MQNFPILFSRKLENFLTHPDEEIFIAVRKHIFVLIANLAVTFITSLFMLSVTLFFIFYVLHLYEVTIATALTISIVTLTFMTKTIIDWYYNIYIVTTKKLLEIRYTPLSSFLINQVFLDQVHCTEIDIKKNGLFSELFDIGTIEFTFDRPTQTEHFFFENVKNSQQLCLFLSEKFDNTHTPDTNTKRSIWYQNTNNNSRYNYVD